MSDEYECHCLAHNFYGQDVLPPINFSDGESVKFIVHGAGASRYSLDKVPYLIKKYDIDIFGIFLDTFMMFEAKFMDCDTSPAKTFFYYPSDGGGGLPSNCDQILRKVNLPISMSKFGQLQVEKVHGIKSVYIPHAFDPKLFYPESFEKKKELRKKWELEGKFVIGCVARNQGRKMLDRGIKAFKLFSLDVPNAVLLLHTDPKDTAQATDIVKLIKDVELTNRVLFTGTSFYEPFTYKAMNEVYNLMDIFLLPTSGEGFGIPIVEAMACGVPQLVTDYTTTKELVTDHIPTGEAIKLVGESDWCPYPHCYEIVDGTITGSWNVERGMMSIYQCSKVLKRLYDDPKTLKMYSDNSVTKANMFYTWDKVIPQFREEFRRLLE